MSAGSRGASSCPVGGGPRRRLGASGVRPARGRQRGSSTIPWGSRRTASASRRLIDIDPAIVQSAHPSRSSSIIVHVGVDPPVAVDAEGDETCATATTRLSTAPATSVALDRRRTHGRRPRRSRRPASPRWAAVPVASDEGPAPVTAHDHETAAQAPASRQWRASKPAGSVGRVHARPVERVQHDAVAPCGR